VEGGGGFFCFLGLCVFLEKEKNKGFFFCVCNQFLWGGVF